MALHLRDPHEQGAWGLCPTQAFFGIECPGCGGLRAVNDLTNLQVLDAASSNLLFVAALPVLAYVFARWTPGTLARPLLGPVGPRDDLVSARAGGRPGCLHGAEEHAGGAWLAPCGCPSGTFRARGQP